MTISQQVGRSLTWLYGCANAQAFWFRARLVPRIRASGTHTCWPAPTTAARPLPWHQAVPPAPTQPAGPGRSPPERAPFQSPGHGGTNELADSRSAEQAEHALAGVPQVRGATADGNVHARQPSCAGCLRPDDRSSGDEASPPTWLWSPVIDSADSSDKSAAADVVSW